MLRLENYFSRLIRFLDILLSFLLFLFFFCSTNDQTFERNNVQISTSAHFTLERILYHNSPTHSPLFVHSRRAYYISRCSNELFSRIELNDSGNVTSRKASTNLVTPSIRKNCLRATCPSPSFLSFLLLSSLLSSPLLFLNRVTFDDNFVRRPLFQAPTGPRSTRTVRFVELVALHGSKRLLDQPVCLVGRHTGASLSDGSSRTPVRWRRPPRSNGGGASLLIFGDFVRVSCLMKM